MTYINANDFELAADLIVKITADKAEIQPCENILCPKYISEKKRIENR